MHKNFIVSGRPHWRLPGICAEEQCNLASNNGLLVIGGGVVLLSVGNCNSKAVCEFGRVADYTVRIDLFKQLCNAARTRPRRILLLQDLAVCRQLVAPLHLFVDPSYFQREGLSELLSQRFKTWQLYENPFFKRFIVAFGSHAHGRRRGSIAVQAAGSHVRNQALLVTSLTSGSHAPSTLVPRTLRDVPPGFITRSVMTTLGGLRNPNHAIARCAAVLWIASALPLLTNIAAMRRTVTWDGKHNIESIDVQVVYFVPSDRVAVAGLERNESTTSAGGSSNSMLVNFKASQRLTTNVRPGSISIDENGPINFERGMPISSSSKLSARLTSTLEIWWCGVHVSNFACFERYQLAATG